MVTQQSVKEPDHSQNAECTYFSDLVAFFDCVAQAWCMCMVRLSGFSTKYNSDVIQFDTSLASVLYAIGDPDIVAFAT